MEPWWSDPLRDVFDGRPVIIAGSVAAAWGPHVQHIEGAGASRIMIVATEGAGAGPIPDVPNVIVEPPEGLGSMERIRFGIAAVEDPPDEIRVAVDRFDPDRSAVVVGSFLNSAAHLDGRPFLAYRRPEWVRLEDKVLVDAFWDRAGVDRLPATVVPKEDAARVWRTVDRGDGTVWAADARDGFHGGATGIRWVVDDASAAAALDALDGQCDRIRVMPFVDGVSCSIHGVVLPDGVAALRPLEMVTLRHGTDLIYAGCSTFWDPPADVREAMRSVARRVGEQLRQEVDFRGAFTVDGVVDGDRFWPTELNPRYGAGLATVARANDGLPMLLVNDLIVGERSIGLAASEFEAEIVRLADERRGGGTWRPTKATAVVDERPVEYDGEWRWATSAVDHGTVTSSTEFVRCMFSPDSVQVGESVAPRAAAFWNFAARELGTRPVGVTCSNGAARTPTG